jgi:hypothetical protein
MKYLAGLASWALLATLALGCTYNVEDSDMRDRLQKASGGGWSKSGKLLVGVPGTTLSMQADFPDSDDYTLQFGILPSINSGGFLIAASAEALITWSVAGNDVSRRVSITNGVSISGTGQAVKVVMMDVTPTGGAFPPALIGQPYPISCQVSRGVRPAVQQPPTLVPISAVPFIRLGAPAGTLFIDVPIPADAGAISYFASVLARDGLGNPIPYVEGMVTVTQLGAVLFTQQDIRNPDEWVPLVPGTTALRFQRETLPAPNDSAIIWLVFGIDG